MTENSPEASTVTVTVPEPVDSRIVWAGGGLVVALFIVLPFFIYQASTDSLWRLSYLGQFYCLAGALASAVAVVFALYTVLVQGADLRVQRQLLATSIQIQGDTARILGDQLEILQKQLASQVGVYLQWTGMADTTDGLVMHFVNRGPSKMLEPQVVGSHPSRGRYLIEPQQKTVVDVGEPFTVKFLHERESGSKVEQLRFAIKFMNEGGEWKTLSFDRIEKSVRPRSS